MLRCFVLQALLGLLSLAMTVTPLRAQVRVDPEWQLQLGRDVDITVFVKGQEWRLPPFAEIVPPTIRVGEVTVMDVTTHGSGSCTRPGPVSVTPGDSVVTVVALDTVRAGACTTDYVAFTRKVVIPAFRVRGVFWLRIVGKDRDRFIQVNVVEPSTPP
ncbi:MAG: hypothetical protein OER90_05415 [Gemmatimonadota bacterium]|nr:hypothetical protein [Gemmatimonadota bacterium]